MLPETSWENLTFYEDMNQAKNIINQSAFEAMGVAGQILLHQSQCSGHCSSRGICVGTSTEKGQGIEHKHCLCAQVS